MRRLLVSCAVASLLVAAGCGDLLDPAAAVVNGQKITVDEVSADLDRFEASAEFQRLAQQGDAQALKRQVEQQLLSQEIRRRVLSPKAQELGIEVTTEEVTERLDRIKQDFETEGAFEEALKEQGLTLEQLDQLLKDSILEEKLRARVVEEAGASDEAAAERAWAAYVEKAYQEADVKVNPRYGEFDDESLQVLDPTAEDVPGAEEPPPVVTPGATANPNEAPSPAG